MTFKHDKRRLQAAFACTGCHRLVLGNAAQSVDQSLPWVDPKEAYTIESHLEELTDEEFSWDPKNATGKHFPDVPESIAQAADEAYRCFSIEAYRASTVLARSVIEASAKNKGVTDNGIAKKIEMMREHQIIPKLLAEAAHEVRLAGNDMAHGDFATTVITRGDAESVLEFMSEILKELFETPARIERMRARNRTN